MFYKNIKKRPVMKQMSTGVQFLIAASIVIMLSSVKPLFAQDVYTSLEEFVQERKESMPLRDSEAYIQPGSDDLDRFESAFIHLKTGDHQSALDEVSRYRYQFAWMELDGFDESILVLYEELPISRGWGTYIYNPGFAHNSAVQIPHPLFDIDTPEMGVQLFKDLQSRWYMLAGTHRYANRSSDSDMSHNENSVFQVAHQVSGAEWVPQLHGFNDQNSLYDEYPQIIISNGTTEPHTVQFNLQDHFRQRDFTAGVYKEETKEELRFLAATKNVQGQYSRNQDDKFIHLEFSNPIRTQSALTQQAVSGMVSGFEISTSIADGYEREAPSGFRVLQNYPNPFNSSTRLHAEVPGSGSIQFEIFNVLGQRVFNQSVQAPSAGAYGISWVASSVATGLYTQRVTWASTNGQVESAIRHMTHIK